eukprot:c22571_g1_i4 orf=76-1551(+)
MGVWTPVSPSPQAMAMALFCKFSVVILIFAIWTSTFLPLAKAASDSEAPESSPSPLADLPDGSGGEEAPSSEFTPEPSPHVAENTPSPSTSLASPPEPTISPSPQGLATSPAPSSPQSAESPDNEEIGSPDASTNSSYKVTWCAVRDEYADCQYYLSLLTTGVYQWSCVRKQSAMECMEAIKAKEVDLITLDAGLAYIAFTKYSMKAIMAEEYCYHKKSYEAVAVVNKERCDANSKLSLGDFRGGRSCHPGYRIAAGWNFPVQFLVKTGLQRLVLDSDLQSDEAVVNSFFSETCAPSEFDGTGLCSSCGNNGSCDTSVTDLYQGYSGAFRCLVEEVGDIAFLRSDTALRLSNDGLNAQNWSTKSVNDFMYLCPDGGCRPINDNIGSCSFGLVPANVIMTFNAQLKAKQIAITETLLNASWTDALYSGKNWEDHVLSSSAQSLVEIRELTRSYLGEAAIVAQDMDSLHNTNISSLPSDGNMSLHFQLFANFN